LIRDVEEDRLLELALIENVQREDLNPMEEAAAYQRLISDLGLSQEQVAERVAKDRSTVANLLRLLRLPEPIQDLVARQELSPGHARPLLSIRDSRAQVRIAKEIVAQGLSVREVERRVKAEFAAEKPGKVEKSSVPPATTDPNTRAAEDRLREALGTRVRILRAGRSGTVVVSFYSEEELQKIYEILLRGARAKVSRVG
jgi:ParB family chromosome partitioning protein